MKSKLDDYIQGLYGDKEYALKKSCEDQVKLLEKAKESEK